MTPESGASERGVMGAPRSHHVPTPRGSGVADSTLGRPDRDSQGGAPHHRMLRLIHTADVHLGARHADLGEQASAQRERQFAAFKATIDLALAEKVDLFLVAGDLFDSNVQPRRRRGQRIRPRRPRRAQRAPGRRVRWHRRLGRRGRPCQLRCVGMSADPRLIPSRDDVPRKATMSNLHVPFGTGDLQVPSSRYVLPVLVAVLIAFRHQGQRVS